MVVVQFELLTLPFVIPTSREATRRNLLFADSFCSAVQETQIPRAKTALGMTIMMKIKTAPLP